MKCKKDQTPTTSELILYQTEDGKTKVEVRLQGDAVWLRQRLMAELFQTTVPNINMRISNIFEEGELAADSVIKDFLITAADGKNYQTKFYNLDVIISALQHYAFYPRQCALIQILGTAALNAEKLGGVVT